MKKYKLTNEQLDILSKYHDDYIAKADNEFEKQRRRMFKNLDLLFCQDETFLKVIDDLSKS